MLKLGEKQTLEVIRMVDFGAYLGESKDSEDQVLLPVKQLPENTEIGNKIEVFLYRDSDDRLIATVKEPKIMLGIVASLDPVANDQAFIDMVWNSEDPGAKELQARIDCQEGREILPYAESLGLGTREYELIEV